MPGGRCGGIAKLTVEESSLDAILVKNVNDIFAENYASTRQFTSIKVLGELTHRYKVHHPKSKTVRGLVQL